MASLSDDLREAINSAAVAFLHREITARGEVRLTFDDLDQHQLSVNAMQAIRVEYEPISGDIILTHAKANASQPVS